MEYIVQLPSVSVNKQIYCAICKAIESRKPKHAKIRRRSLSTESRNKWSQTDVFGNIFLREIIENSLINSLLTHSGKGEAFSNAINCQRKDINTVPPQ